MYFLGEFFWIIALAWLVVDYFISREFQEVAEEKGFINSKKYFWWTFFTGIFGMLLVIALPDRKEKKYVELTKVETTENQQYEDVIPEKKNEEPQEHLPEL